MTDSEALRSRLPGASDWRYVETSTAQTLHDATARWHRLREARELQRREQDQESGTRG